MHSLQGHCSLTRLNPTRYLRQSVVSISTLERACQALKNTHVFQSTRTYSQ